MEDLLLQGILGTPTKTFALQIIAALAGGAFGAAIGALPAFIFTGFVVFLGSGIALVDAGLAKSLVGMGFGTLTGPHIVFAGGVAATAYAGKKYPDMEPDGWDYHFGKNILYAFGTKPDILAVGAIFGVIGYLITLLGGAFVTIGGTPATDWIAFSVFASAMLARVAFGYPLIGSPSGSGYMDMSPFENGESHAQAEGGPEEHAGRLATEPWLPHQYKWSGVATIGLIGGVIGGFVYLQTGQIFLTYAVSAISLLFLNLGVEKIPVTHHITLLGSVGAVIAAAAYGDVASATVPLGAIGTTGVVVSLLAAGVFGAISGLLGEVTQRIFYAHSGTHVDPPAMAIAIFMFVIFALSVAGVIPNAGYL